MNRRRVLVLLTLASSIPTVGLYASDPPTQGVEVRAEDGERARDRVAGRKPKTERLFLGGVWLQKTYDEGNPSALRRVEAPGEIHTFQYDSAFNVVGKTVAIGGATLSITSRSGWTSATGLPDISVRSDETGAVREIASPTETLATFVFDPNGKSAEITLRGGLRLLIEVNGGMARQTLYAAEGNLLFTTSFERNAGRKFVSKFNLDVLTRDLGLSYDWGRDRSRIISPTGFSESVVGKNGESLVHMIDGIPMGKALVDLVTTPAGKPICYRITLFGMGNRMPAFPWRVLVTPDGGISFDSPDGPHGSVISFWSRGGSIGYRVDKEKVEKPGTLTPLNLAICSSGVCTSSGSSTHCEWEPYWCDDGGSWGGGGGGGGGAGDGGGDPGGGGGGGGGGRADGSALTSTELAKLDSAEIDAYNRLDNPTCGSLFAEYGQPPRGGQGISNMSKTYLYGQPGSDHCPDDSTIAATPQGVATTYLCPGFFSRSLMTRSITLIHEAVHTAGLPQTHAGMSSQAFQDTVAGRCP